MTQQDLDAADRGEASTRRQAMSGLAGAGRTLSTQADGTVKLVLSAAAAATDWAAPHGNRAAAWLADADVAVRAAAREALPLPGTQHLSPAPDVVLHLAAAEAPVSAKGECPLWLGHLIIAVRKGAGAVERHFVGVWPSRAQARLASITFMASVALACMSLGLLLGNVAKTSEHPIATAARWRPWGGGDFGGPEDRSGLVAAPAPQPQEGGVVRESAAQAAAPPAAAPAPVVPIPPSAKGALPVGKGMWLWLPERAEGGNAEAIVNRAKANNMTHLYVRTGSSKGGFYAQGFLNQLLPVAHANGIRIYGWDFPYLLNVNEDVQRGLAAINYTTPDGHRIDGFVADIETGSEGTNINGVNAFVYGKDLRAGAGAGYPLISCVPRPSYRLTPWFPYAEATAHFDAIAPMVYWLNREPVGDVTEAMRHLSQFGKPIIPVGQAYDGAPEGGRPGVPPAAELEAFMRTAEELGATGVSFWSWQHADQQAWDAIRDSQSFRLPAGNGPFRTGEIRAYQSLLTSLGFPVAVNGVWDGAMANAVSAYQQAAKLPVTGVIDEQTRSILLQPFNPPIQPGQ